jgi:type IV pilus assembly protein PilB
MGTCRGNTPVENALERVNCDIIRCMVAARISTAGLQNDLSGVDAETSNEKIVKFLRDKRRSGKIRDCIGVEIFAGDVLVKNSDAINFVGEKFSAYNHIVPISLKNREPAIAIADPFDVKTMDVLREKFRGDVSFQLVPFAWIKQFWNASDGGEVDRVGAVNNPQVSAAEMRSESQLLDKFFEDLISDAISRRASDIHLENTCDGMRVRMRVDGKLRVVKTMDKISAQAAVAKIKIDANAKIDEARLPQDRRVRMKIFGKNYDLRISILPTIHGENIALRIFDQVDNDFDLGSIGMDGEQLQLLETMIGAQNGLVLLCGPTGCGKTTTLYTILKKISSPRRKVITIEDPIEYRLDGINQVPVNDEIGLSFASILRSVLRQSPNIIMVGEIRDRETAELAIQAALTGHLVLSTVHCGASPGAITRLVDFGISEHLIKSCLRGAIAQKLARKPCQSCSAMRELSRSERSLLAKFCPALRKVPKTRGCGRCYQTGCVGRTAVFDFLINRNLCAANAIPRGRATGGDFFHAETFADGVSRLLKNGSIVFEDAQRLLFL